MSIPQTVTEILRDHVTLEVESIDRMYLNLYVPKLQYEGGIASFFRYHRGMTFASSSLMAPMTEAFVASIKAYAKVNEIPLVRFAKGQRKDDVAAEYLARVRPGRRRAFHRRCSRESQRLPDRETTQSGYRSDLSLDCAFDGHGQSVLHLCR